MIEVHRSLDTAPAGTEPIVVAVPRGDLAAAVDLLERSPRVGAAVFADDVDAVRVAALDERRRDTPPLGLRHVLSESCEPFCEVVADAADKARCISRILTFVAAKGASANDRARIEQCVDEMLMNALFDAPLDAQGKSIFAGVPTRKRIQLRTDQTVAVSYACDGQRFAVAVRDAFGALERDTLVRHLRKALHASQAVDRKAGGAGLGLYLMATAARALWFDVVPGVSTEAVCMFELGASTHELDHIAFFTHATTTATPTPPARVRLADRVRKRRIAAGMIAMIATVLAVIFVPRLLALRHTAILVSTTPAATVELDGRRVGTASDGTLTIDELDNGRVYRLVAHRDGYVTKHVLARAERGTQDVTLVLEPTAQLELDSTPSDAIVQLDGTPVGSTPLTLTQLPPTSTVALTFVRPGYRATTARVQVPARGRSKHYVQALELDPGAVRVHVTSNPPGAAIVEDGRRTPDHTYTPADVFVIADQPHQFSLEMQGHKPLLIAPFTPPRGAAPIEIGGDLP